MELATVEKVWELQRTLRALPQATLPTRHFLCNGMYGREIFIPAGTVYIGKVHRTDHFFVILRGQSVMTTDEGTRNIQAPEVLVVKAGSKRAGVALSDCIFIAFHRTDETEIDDIEADLTEPDPTSCYDVFNKLLPFKENL
jgi:hypothetical protein